MTLRFDEIVSAGGEIYPVDAHDLRMEGESTAEGDVQKLLGGTLGGLVIGGILGGGDGAKKGAAGGAVAGGIYAVMTRGNDIVLPAGTEVAFVLDGDLTLPHLAAR
jgi:outer membrane lipoprotein SlyB